MSEPHRCCETTVNDLNAAHRRVNQVELQLMLLLAKVDGLAKALEDEQVARAGDHDRHVETITSLERHLRDANAELGAVTTDRDNWRKSHANTAKQQRALSTQVDDLTKKLAAVTMERDTLLRAKAATVIHNIQEEAA